MKCHRTCWFLSLWVFLSGCGGQPDYQRIADDRVRDQLADEFGKREAIPFFEGAGRFFDVDQTTNVDREVVLPLLKRLAEIEPDEQWVVLRPETSDWAMALLVKLPEPGDVLERMAQAVQEADDSYSGFIIQQWGHEWLSMALVDATVYEFLKKNDPNVDKQR